MTQPGYHNPLQPDCRTTVRKAFFAFMTCAVMVLPARAADTPSQPSDDYEQRVIASIQDIQEANIDASLDSLEKIIEEYPNSKVGHLVLADLLAIRGGSRSIQPEAVGDPLQLQGLRDEIRHRWNHNILGSPAINGMLPSNLVKSSTASEHVILVDASQARLYVYRNTGDSHQLVDHFYITVGKSGMGKLVEGDLKTPIGVYQVTSYIPGDGLPDRYGPGAFPINYPNAYDRMNQRTGYGIWIHGTESENYNRVPWASDGCVSLSNDAFIEISQYIRTDGSTPVIIAESFDWRTPGEISQLDREYRGILKNWLADWQSLDHEKYAAHYSTRQFRGSGLSRDRFLQRKKRVNRSKTYVDVAVEDLSIYVYPGPREMLHMSFTQRYNSNNHNSVSRKTMIWEREASGQWKIVFEG